MEQVKIYQSSTMLYAIFSSVSTNLSSDVKLKLILKLKIQLPSWKK
jgi:hypothetical protein